MATFNSRIMPGKVSSKTSYKYLLILLILEISFLYSITEVEGATFCVSTPEELQNALATAATNGEDDLINIVQGVYNGNFIYTSTEEYGLTIRGGFEVGCALRVADATNTVLDAGV